LIEEWDGRQSAIDMRFKQKLCDVVFSNFTFLAFVLMLRVMMMIIEFRTNWKLFFDIVYRVNTVPNSAPGDMVMGMGGGLEGSEDDDEKILIVGLTPLVRIFTVGFIIVPKFVIGFFLMTMGMVWLSATESFSDLILNSLALQFVLSIDEHIFEALLPEPYRNKLAEQVHMRFPIKKKDIDEVNEEDWQYWKTSTIIFIFIPTFVFTYLKCLQFLPFLGVLPYFRSDIAESCAPYLESHKVRICPSGFSNNCFPYGGWQHGGRLALAGGR